MKKYNKGTTIVEILVSISIISIVLIFLFALLVRIRKESNYNNVDANYLVNQATLIKNLNEDFVNYGVSSISSCQLGDAPINTSYINGDKSNSICIKINYSASYLKDNIGYVLVYHYYTDSSMKETKWVVEYTRGKYNSCVNSKYELSSWESSLRILREYEEDVNLNVSPYVLYTAASIKKNAAQLVIPISDSKDQRYDISIAFTYENNFTCDNSSSRLSCKCKSGNSLCANTYNYTDECSN